MSAARGLRPIVSCRLILDRIATHILAAEGDSHWTFFDGNYQEYEADKRKQLGDNQRLSERRMLA